MNSLAKFVGGFVLIVFSLVFGAFITGFTFSWLWLWFAVPLFSLPVLSVWQAAGVAIVVRYIAIPIKKDKSVTPENSFSKLGESIALSVIYSVIVLGLGYLFSFAV